MEQVYAFYMVCGSAFDSMVDGVVFRRNFIRLAIASDLKLAQFQSHLATIPGVNNPADWRDFLCMTERSLSGTEQVAKDIVLLYCHSNTQSHNNTIFGKSMNKMENTIFDLHFAELYHTGMSLIPAWKLLHLFSKDGGRVTKAFFRDEIFSLWSDYISEVETIHISVNLVRADHGVSKPAAYLLTRDDFLYTFTDTDTDSDEEDED